MSAQPHVGVQVELMGRGMWEVPFWNLAAQLGLRHLHRRRFPFEDLRPPDLSAVGAELRFSDCGGSGRLVWTYVVDGRATILLCSYDRSAELLVLAATPEAAEAVAGRLEADLRTEPPDDGRVSITHWALTSSGPRRRRQRVPAPRWGDIAGNYTASTAGGLEHLFAATEMAEARLILWHGPPGTGKTTALRALAGAWDGWCDVHYIADPEELFGNGAAYLTDVLVDDEEQARLLVLEDSGELMAADARRGTGQGLSRLLNLTDGMLGQGQDIAILITTNEPLGRLHPAVTRPGRCWAEIAFDPLSAAEANGWLARHELPLRVQAEKTLAELYALRRGEAVRERPPFGFAARA